jgi:hypothetical protein
MPFYSHVQNCWRIPNFTLRVSLTTPKIEFIAQYAQTIDSHPSKRRIQYLMAPSVAAAKKARIQAKIELGMPPLTIFEEEHVSLRTVQRFATNYRRFSQLNPPKALYQGRPRTITPEMEEVSPLFVFYRCFYIR